MPETAKIKCTAKGQYHSEPLTEEWLRKVGLHDGLGFANKIRIRLCGDRFLLEIRWIADNFAHKYTDLKTIGDARTLCRLLGVTIKE